MIGWMSRLFAGPEPAFGETTPRDAAAIAVLHGTAFRRGWGRDEVERLLLDRQVVGHRVTVGRAFAGFILSRFAADEAEILSVAVDRRRRGRGLARRLLDLHLRRLAGLGVKSVFLEVEEDNPAARRLYDRAGFRQVGKRQGYYQRDSGAPAAALVLRRDLA
jgi:[ribosomal protein S18]-alanine N-acetyltransferase